MQPTSAVLWTADCFGNNTHLLSCSFFSPVTWGQIISSRRPFLTPLFIYLFCLIYLSIYTKSKIKVSTHWLQIFIKIHCNANSPALGGEPLTGADNPNNAPSWANLRA